MSPTSPHSNKLCEAHLDCFGSVLNISIPDLIGSLSGHLKLIIFNDVDSHDTLVIGVGFFC